MSTQWFYWWAGLGPITFLLVRDRALEETSGLRSAGSPWFTPTLGISTVFLDLSFLKAKFSCWPAYYRKQYLWETSASHLQVKFVIFYISVEAIDCFHVFWSQFKVKHLEGRRITLTSPPSSRPPLGTGGLSSWMETRRGDREACLFSVSRWISLGPSAEFSPLLPTPSPSLSTWKRLHCISHLSF